jgi:hypothetical protein
VKQFLNDHPFADQAEEIYFFKTIKPEFHAWHIYALEIYTIESERPLGDDLTLKAYYEQELKYLKRFFIQNQFMYQYYRLGADELDPALFIRGANKPSLLINPNADPDPEFSTPCDHLFSLFIGYEKVQEYLITAISGPAKADKASDQNKNAIPLRWTGDKSNLVELAYGIYDTAQINNGEADIWQIIEWLEQSLQISLKRYYQVFAEIKNRKAVSKTRYIDHMKVMLSAHIENGETFKPQIPKPVSGSKSAVKK